MQFSFWRSAFLISSIRRGFRSHLTQISWFPVLKSICGPWIWTAIPLLEPLFGVNGQPEVFWKHSSPGTSESRSGSWGHIAWLRWQHCTFQQVHLGALRWAGNRPHSSFGKFHFIQPILKMQVLFDWSDRCWVPHNTRKLPKYRNFGTFWFFDAGKIARTDGRFWQLISFDQSKSSAGVFPLTISCFSARSYHRLLCL